MAINAIFPMYLHYLEQLVEQNSKDKRSPIRQICYMVFSFVKRLAIIFHLCKCIDEHVNICLQIMAMIKTCNFGYMY